MRYPDELIDFCKENCNGKTNEELAGIVNKKFGTTLNKKTMGCLIKNHKITRTEFAKRVVPGKFDDFKAELERLIPGHYAEDVSKALCNMGHEITPNQVRTYMKNHHIANGMDGTFHTRSNKYERVCKPNSGCFQPGHGAKPIGSESKINNYWKVKVGERKWRYKHILVWEAAHGKVKKGMRIIFLDGNADNVSLDNLEEVTATEMAMLNVYNRRTNDRDVTRAYAKLTRLEQKIKEKDEQITEGT